MHTLKDTVVAEKPQLHWRHGRHTRILDALVMA